MLTTKKPEIVSIGRIPLATTSHEKLLGVTISLELKFENYISKLCLKVCLISSFMSIEKRRTLIKAFIESQFNYFLRILMLHFTTLSNKINRIHERTLKTAYSDHKSSSHELLDKIKYKRYQLLDMLQKVCKKTKT